MLRTERMELLRPDEIREEQKEHNIVYLPLGPLEWHGPAMPYGTDPLFAEAVARRSARMTGGLVMPTLWLGTERKREDEILRCKGFEDPIPYIEGMDVPANNLPSMYAREEVFAITVREYISMLVGMGFCLIVIVNGHGAFGQLASLERLAAEFSAKTKSKVIQFLALVPVHENDDIGHGTQIETSVMISLYPDCVDLGRLPAKPEKLAYVKYGIADDFVFGGHRSPDDSVVYDPRDATSAMGDAFVRRAVENSIEQVNKALEEMKR